MAPIKEAVYATLLLNDAYLPGAVVLAHSLKDRGAKARVVALATVDNLSADVVAELETVYDEIVPINRIVNRHPANLYLMDRPDLISTFTKIELWRQTQFSQIVYIDADMVAIRAPNELLNYEVDFAAVPDIGWPDCFNSGLLVLRPNLGDYYSLLALAQRGISFDGADQGLLNMHFQHWQRLSFTYNCTPSGSYQYVPAYRHFQSSISLVHFIGRDKPWTTGRDDGNVSGVYGELLGRWWATYDKHYRRHVSDSSRTNLHSSRTVRDLVVGEKTTAYLGFASSEPRSGQFHLPLVDVKHTSEPQNNPTEAGHTQNQPTKKGFTAESRPFTAPRMEWDASRAPPPVDSKPEASNFPSQVYQFNHDTSLFQPPRYSDAASTEKPKPIFPWEGHAPKPTRVFPEEQLLDAASVPKADLELVVTSESPFGDAEASQEFRRSGSNAQASADVDLWNTYTRANAWDSMPEIERYIQAFAHARKGKVQILHDTTPLSEASPSDPTTRRSSMKLTDFPTEVERPSLPVTPAPRRPSFWGEERDEAGELPAADGVPKQEDWVYWRCQFCGKQNPAQKLEELQVHQSEVLESGPDLHPKELPKRDMLESAADPAVAPSAITLPGTIDSTKDTASSTSMVAGRGPAATNGPSSTKPKSILKEPSFELGDLNIGDTSPAANDMAAESEAADVMTSA